VTGDSDKFRRSLAAAGKKGRAASELWSLADAEFLENLGLVLVIGKRLWRTTLFLWRSACGCGRALAALLHRD
jgi:hypothetical protein